KSLGACGSGTRRAGPLRLLSGHLEGHAVLVRPLRACLGTSSSPGVSIDTATLSTTFSSGKVASSGWLSQISRPRGLSTNGGRNGGEGESEGEEEPREEEEPSSDDLVKEVESLREEVAKVKEGLKDAEAKALYAAAEMENVRAIARRDAEGARQYAVQKFAKQLLDVADNLTRAMESAKEGGAGLESLLEGVEMTDAELQKAFKSQGLHKFGEVGDKFDPHHHDAMFEYVDPSKEPGTLGQVWYYPRCMRVYMCICVYVHMCICVCFPSYLVLCLGIVCSLLRASEHFEKVVDIYTPDSKQWWQQGWITVTVVSHQTSAFFC
ncbi:unnamed protein product, partial [Discosporangium mesarthrocarpum]